MKRRDFVLKGAAFGAAQGLFGCGGSGGGAATAGNQQPVEWNVAPAPHLFVNFRTIVVDIGDSLPAGIRRGGQFSVDGSGARLPPGVVLSPDGILSMTDAANEGVTTGVVFRYTEPA